MKQLNLYRKNPIPTENQSVNGVRPSVNPPVNPSASENIPSINLPISLRQVLSLIADNPKITYEQLAEKMSRNRDTIRVYINRLRSEFHLLERVGATKNGQWVIMIPVDEENVQTCQNDGDQ